MMWSFGASSCNRPRAQHRSSHPFLLTLPLVLSFFFGGALLLLADNIVFSFNWTSSLIMGQNGLRIWATSLL